MHTEQKEADRILTKARRGLDLDSADAFGDPAERAWRVGAYARQVEQNGRINEWMPRVEPHRDQRHGRFSFGDALGRHLAACAG